MQAGFLTLLLGPALRGNEALAAVLGVGVVLIPYVALPAAQRALDDGTAIDAELRFLGLLGLLAQADAP